MPGCGSTSCACSIKVGPGLAISGTGALDAPFRIELAGLVEESLTVEDSTTIDLRLNGGGSPANPYQLSATAKVRVTDLVDVHDPEGAPSSGDTLVWVTAGVETPRWEFRPPPAAPAGAVNVSSGLQGVGSVGDPIRVKTVSAPGGSTGGLEVYVDSAGNLRAVNPGGSTVSWDTGITDKPTVFPTDSNSFGGILATSKGGTGTNNLADVTVGNALRIDGRVIYVQSSQPSGSSHPVNSLWFW